MWLTAGHDPVIVTISQSEDRMRNILANERRGGSSPLCPLSV